MDVLVTVIHLAACCILIIIVLLQKGKGADLAGAFGGGGSQTAFGVRSATRVIHKLTIAAAVFFMITSYTLGLIQSGTPSLASEIESRAEQGRPPLENIRTGAETDQEGEQAAESDPAEEPSQESSPQP